jgi:hypothetical protein
VLETRDKASLHIQKWAGHLDGIPEVGLSKQFSIKSTRRKRDSDRIHKSWTEGDRNIEDRQEDRE